MAKFIIISDEVEFISFRADRIEKLVVNSSEMYTELLVYYQDLETNSIGCKLFIYNSKEEAKNAVKFITEQLNDCQ